MTGHGSKPSQLLAPPPWGLGDQHACRDAVFVNVQSAAAPITHVHTPSSSLAGEDAEGVQISLACSPDGCDNSLFCAASGLNCPSGSLAPGQTNLDRPPGTPTLRTSNSIFILRCEQNAHEQLPQYSAPIFSGNEETLECLKPGR